MIRFGQGAAESLEFGANPGEVDAFKTNVCVQFMQKARHSLHGLHNVVSLERLARKVPNLEQFQPVQVSRPEHPIAESCPDHVERLKPVEANRFAEDLDDPFGLPICADHGVNAGLKAAADAFQMAEFLLEGLEDLLLECCCVCGHAR